MNPCSEPDAEPHGPWQYSIQSLLILTAAVAVGCSVVFGLPDWAAGLLFLFLALTLPPVLLVVLRHGNPDQKAFALGALFPACAMLFSLVTSARMWVPWNDLELESTVRFVLLLIWFGGGGGIGALCVFVRRWLERTGSRGQGGPDERK